MANYMNVARHTCTVEECIPLSNHTRSELRIRNHLLKWIHCYLLSQMPADVLGYFYRRLPLPLDSQVLENDAVVEHIWNENLNTPSSYFNTFLDAVEKLIVKRFARGLSLPSMEQFLSSMITANTCFDNLFIRLSTLLAIEIDVRKYLLQAVHAVPSVIFEDAQCFIADMDIGSGNDYIMAGLFQNRTDVHKNGVLDAEMAFAQIARILPAFFSLPVFSGYKIHFQEQCVEERLWDGTSVDYLDGNCLLDGNVVGKRIRFSEIVAGNYPKLQRWLSGDPEVTLIQNDYVCPNRKRRILERNCVYGAPFSLISVFDLKKNKPAGCYDAVIGCTENTDLWSILEKKHAELLRYLKGGVEVRFDKKSQLVLINKKPIVSGVQAKLFRAIIRLYLERENDLFEWRDLAANDELFNDPYNNGISTRLNRLIDTLQREQCGCTIEKASRGKYRLKFDARLSYHE